MRKSTRSFTDGDQSRLLCEPSQFGWLPVCLQLQRAILPSSAISKMCGANEVPPWEPSQKGCPLDSPQVQKAYFPALRSRTAGDVPAILGLSILGSLAIVTGMAESKRPWVVNTPIVKMLEDVKYPIVPTIYSVRIEI
jgi:hypothetical protein